MLGIRGSLWDYHDAGHWVVVPTSGVVTQRGAVMGQGVALQAAKRYPDLPKELGLQIKKWGSMVRDFPKYRLLTFPTKKHWQSRASLSLIEWGCRWLTYLAGDNQASLYLPQLGCGAGGLSWRNEVKPVMGSILDDRFVVVEYLPKYPTPLEVDRLPDSAWPAFARIG